MSKHFCLLVYDKRYRRYLYTYETFKECLEMRDNFLSTGKFRYVMVYKKLVVK